MVNILLQVPFTLTSHFTTVSNPCSRKWFLGVKCFVMLPTEAFRLAYPHACLKYLRVTCSFI
uniref:Uncharacterized protein n=1 Tax=Arundo donax TaxID=35708 RepID=A0A0A9DG90_ARUDO